MTAHPQSTPPERQTLFILDLFRDGFSAEEILRLRELRAGYPLTEYLSQTDRDRLAFLRWQLRRGARDEG